MITPDFLHAKLGNFVLTFQAVEAAMVELIVQIADADSEYIATLTAELEFTAKARALDVIYTRFAQIHQITTESPEPRVHSLVTGIQKLATRRNDLVHSFYALLSTVDGTLALARQPTKLKPSDGLRKQAEENILPDRLTKEIEEMKRMLREIEALRLSVINLRWS
jgi:hypothetical protein